MTASQQRASFLRRAAPPSLDEASIEEGQEDDSLDWTFTPEFMILKDGHARCFIATAPSGQETRFHAPHLVREFDIEPSFLGKQKGDRKLRRNAKTAELPRVMRVREEDLRKCGGDLDLLRQCELPRMQPNMMQQPPSMSKQRRNKIQNGGRHICFEPLRCIPEAGRDLHKDTSRIDSSTSKRSSSVPTVGAPRASSLHLPTLRNAPPGQRQHSTKKNCGFDDRAACNSESGGSKRMTGVASKRCHATTAPMLRTSASLPTLV